MARFVQTLLISLIAASGALAKDGQRVVAVNYALHYMAERLADDQTEVVFPVPQGVDPSYWRPAIADISMIQSADLILLNGAGFANWVDRVSLPRSKIVNTSASLTDRYIATETITHSHGDGGEHSHEGTASYLWLDPELAALQAEAIAQALVARGLADEAAVETRLSALRADLAALDKAAETTLAPLQGTTLIATHPRYQYLGRAFGLRITALDWEAGAAPSPDQLAALAAVAKETGATALIWEADPPAAALEATAALGLQNLIFPPLAQTPGEADFLAAYQAALADFAAITAPGN